MPLLSAQYTGFSASELQLPSSSTAPEAAPGGDDSTTVVGAEVQRGREQREGDIAEAQPAAPNAPGELRRHSWRCRRQSRKLVGDLAWFGHHIACSEMADCHAQASADMLKLGLCGGAGMAGNKWICNASNRP